jgi:hypothetical protein
MFHIKITRKEILLATLRDIKKKFFSLSKKDQENMLKEIYGFSKDMKEFLNVRLLGDGEEKFIEQIKKATESTTSIGMPKIIKVVNVNSILNKAKKSNVKKETLCDMEWYAFDGYMTFLNDYGGGPDSFENKVYDHLKNYLLLLIEISNDKQKLEDELLGVENYLSQHDNMYNDHLYELYEDLSAEYVCKD